jgi:hypothetical protein
MNVKNVVMSAIVWMFSTQMCTVYVLVILVSVMTLKILERNVCHVNKGERQMDYRFTALLIVLMVALALLGGPADYNTP